MRERLILLAGAAFLAAVHVIGVLLGSPVWPPALVGALLALAAAGASTAAPRWLVPVALAPLILQAALTVPRVRTGDYGWFVTEATSEPARSAVLLDALDTGFRLAGAPLLFAAVLLVAIRADRTRAIRSDRSAQGSRVIAAAVALAGLPVVAYAVLRVGAVNQIGPAQIGPAQSGMTRAAAVAVPVAFAVLTAALAALIVRRRRRWPGVLGALLLTISALPMIDSALDALPSSFSSFEDPTRLFGWDVITPSDALPGPVPALTVGFQLAGFLLLSGVGRPIRPYGA